MALLPDWAGAAKDTLILPLSTTTPTMVGAPGVRARNAGVTTFEAAEGAPVPSELMAVTVKV